LTLDQLAIRIALQACYREELPPLRDGSDGGDAPLVYVTFGSVLGTLPGAAAVYRAAIDAGAPLRVRVLVTVGHDVDVATLGRMPANVHVAAWVPQAEVLDTAAVVVAHGGSGTTLGALAAGVPLVLVPLFADQLANAQRVGSIGAAAVVEPDRGPAGGMGKLGPEDSPRLRAAVETVMRDPAYARAARRVAGEMRTAPRIGELLAAVVASKR
jgi:MGT family glycosyltransferase